MEIQKFIFFCGLVFLVFGCTTGNCRSQKIKQEQAEGPMPLKDNKLIPPKSLAERVRVFKFDGTLQCSQGKRIEISIMEKELKDIKIFKSYSENDGMMRTQNCGSPTGNAHVFEIERESLNKALSLGFKEWVKN